MSYHYDEVTDPSATVEAKTWVWQALIVFAQDSSVTFPRTQHPIIRDSNRFRVRWLSHFENESPRINSIDIFFKPNGKTIQIDKKHFELQKGNLFCIFVDADMEFDRVDQLAETSNAKATIADFKRLLPMQSDVQAIQMK